MATPPAPLVPLGPDLLGTPYKLACLCDLRDRDGRILLLRRNKEPNKGLCSPIGGKLDMHTGESPAQCAQREIEEEAGIHVPIDLLHLGGLISEKSFDNGGGSRSHWLMFYYRVLGTVEVTRTQIREGTLEWFHPEQIEGLPLPETDRRIIWPMIRRHEETYEPGRSGSRPGFFALHIDCSKVAPDGKPEIVWTVEQEER